MANSARIDELKKKFDENPRRYFAPLANEYRKSGDLAQAVFILEEYLPQQPGHISGHIVYGQTLFELGRDEEAKRVFEAALSLDPENLIALRHLGHISRQAGDFDAARSWYARLLEADPRDAEIEQLLGSLEAAAQAHAAELSRLSQSAPLPPPAPVMSEVDDSPLQIEHLVQQESPGAPPRAETHPLAPPPLPPREELASAPAMATPAAAMEPPPLPEAEAPEASHDEVAATEELLDGDDFSFGSPDAAAPATNAQACGFGERQRGGGRVGGDLERRRSLRAPAIEATACDEGRRTSQITRTTRWDSCRFRISAHRCRNRMRRTSTAWRRTASSRPDGPVAEAERGRPIVLSGIVVHGAGTRRERRPGGGLRERRDGIRGGSERRG